MSIGDDSADEEGDSFRYHLFMEEEDALDLSPFCWDWIQRSVLRMLMLLTTRKAYKTQRTLSLFFLFLTQSMFEALSKWTHERLRASAQDENLNLTEMRACLDLEIASLTKVSVLQETWNTKKFAGVSDFSAVMPRDHFKKIRAALKLSPA